MPRYVTVLTPENVELRFMLASPLDRAIALIVDSLLQLLIAGLIGIPAAIALASTVTDPSIIAWGTVTMVVVIPTLVQIIYNVAFECLWNGQTPGKRLMRVRVLRDKGFPIDFRASLIRNIVRLLDAFPLNYGVGIISVLFSKEFKRVGDFAAGTIVVREGAPTAPDEIPMPPPLEFDEFELQALDPLAAANIVRLRRDHYLAIRHALQRLPQLPDVQRLHYAERIARAIMQMLGQQPPSDENFNYERFLTEVAWAYERRFYHGGPE